MIVIFKLFLFMTLSICEINYKSTDYVDIIRYNRIILEFFINIYSIYLTKNNNRAISDNKKVIKDNKDILNCIHNKINHIYKKRYLKYRFKKRLLLVKRR